MKVPLVPMEGDIPVRQSDMSETIPETTVPEVSRVGFNLYPINRQPNGHSLLVKIQPPREPTHHIHHVPCEIVLVIDISGSMSVEAPIPGESENESTGLSVLDLVKHAALTIIETLDERDRLGIVEFADQASIVQELLVMTDENKEEARAKIKGLHTQGATNLWHGIQQATKLFQSPQPAERVPAIMVLTDGWPNRGCPNTGYVPKLETMMPLPATIHTFGFGYNLRSGLLKSIAEIGGGHFAFIPDSGMVGTVFVHAVANLQSTYATDASLTLQYDESVTVEEMSGDLVAKEESTSHTASSGNQFKRLSIPLGNIQYGQSRDLFFNVTSSHDEKRAMNITASIQFNPVDILWSGTTGRSQTETHCNILDKQTISKADAAYHESRAMISNFLSSLAPMDNFREHVPLSLTEHSAMQSQLDELIKTIPAQNYTDVMNKSLMQDLVGSRSNGQILLALQELHYSRWGQHYYLSLSNAYTKQICNSFKDAGPLQFGANSPLFIACRDRLDNAFDNLPPPEPSLMPRHGDQVSSAPLSMASYRNASGPCFAGSTPVELASGRTVDIKRLRRGMKVRTPMGTRKVAAMVKTIVHDMVIFRVGKVLVTPWHPISMSGDSWVFPAHVADGPVRYTGAIYSVILQRDSKPEAHALRLDGLWGVTLGHGITSGTDTRAHAFLGDYNLVGKSIVRLGVDQRGLALSGGVQREERGLIVGFHSAKDMVSSASVAPACGKCT